MISLFIGVLGWLVWFIICIGIGFGLLVLFDLPGHLMIGWTIGCIIGVVYHVVPWRKLYDWVDDLIYAAKETYPHERDYKKEYAQKATRDAARTEKDEVKDLKRQKVEL